MAKSILCVFAILILAVSVQGQFGPPGPPLLRYYPGYRPGFGSGYQPGLNRPSGGVAISKSISINIGGGGASVARSSAGAGSFGPGGARAQSSAGAGGFGKR